MLPKPVILQITKTISVTLFILLCVFSYTALRHQTFSLFILNKAIAGTAGMILGLVLMTGPISRVYTKLSFLMMYRKWLGMASFIVAYLHMVISLFLLPEYFPLSNFHIGNIAFIFASISTLILSALFLLSFEQFIHSLNKKLWWKIHNWGLRFSVLFGLFHVVLVKYDSWLGWFLKKDSGNGQFLPPTGLLISLFLLYIFGIRFIEFRGRNFAYKTLPMFSILFTLMFIGGILGGILNNIL